MLRNTPAMPLSARLTGVRFLDFRSDQGKRASVGVFPQVAPEVDPPEFGASNSIKKNNENTDQKISGGRAAAPRTPAARKTGSSSVGGSSATEFDLDSYVPRARARTRAHRHSRPRLSPLSAPVRPDFHPGVPMPTPTTRKPVSGDHSASAATRGQDILRITSTARGALIVARRPPTASAIVRAAAPTRPQPQTRRRRPWSATAVGSVLLLALGALEFVEGCGLAPGALAHFALAAGTATALGIYVLHVGTSDL